MISLRTLWGFIVKELTQALRDPRMRFLLLVTPMIQLFFFGIAISTDVKNIRLWAELDGKDYVLQHIYEHSIASKWFLPAATRQVMEPYDLIRGGRVDAALVPPPGGVTHSIIRDASSLQLLIDATNVIQAQSVEAYLKNIANQVVESDLVLKPLPSPISFSTRILFNPTLETAFFMVPGVMCMLLCVVSVILTNMAISREKELGTFEMLISAPISATEIILGKTIPYVLIAMADVPLVLIVAVGFFGLPMRGSLAVLFLAAFAFVCATVSIGTFMATFTKNQQQSMLSGVLFIFPATLFSGLMFPIENMPALMKGAAYLNPLYHFLILMRNITLKGGDVSFVALHVGVLVLIALVVMSISFKRFKTTLQ